MEQLDVYRNPSARSSPRIPYFVVLADTRFFAHALTVVAPLVVAFPKPDPKLNPAFRIEDVEVLLSPIEMGSVRTSDLRIRVDSLGAHRDRILRALDFLFTGL